METISSGPKQHHYGTKRPLGAIEFVRRLRDNAISIYPPPSFSARYGVRRLGLQRLIFLNHPDYIQHVLVSHAGNYGKGRLTRQILGPVLGKGLFTAEGALWKAERRASAPAFRHQRLVALVPLMAGIADQWADKLSEAAAKGKRRDIAADMGSLTLEIVARALFSEDLGGALSDARGSVQRIMGGLGRPSLLDLTGMPEWLPRRQAADVTQAIRELDRFVAGVVSARRQAAVEPDDLLTMLIKSVDDQAALDEAEGATAERLLRDQILTMFAAGHETTATALAWTWYLLATHPEVRERLCREIDKVAGQAPLTYELIEAMPYARQVIEEAMRLYPPAYSISRVAEQADRIGPLDVRRGDIVSLSPYVTHRNPIYWPDPEFFRPERFAPDQTSKRPKFVYFPFGAGPRICIGAGFAMLEARIIIVSLARRLTLELAPDHPVVPHARITLRPRYGVKVSIAARRRP